MKASSMVDERKRGVSFISTLAGELRQILNSRVSCRAGALRRPTALQAFPLPLSGGLN
jgi:hypothetical protein